MNLQHTYRCLLFAAVFGAVPASAVFADGVSHTVMLTESGGAPVLGVYDELAGVVTLAKGLHTSDPEFKYVPVRRYGLFDGKFMRAADLNGDGLLDLVLPGYAAQRVLVLWGETLDGSDLRLDEMFVGPGPAAAAPARVERSAASQLFIATTARAQVEVRGWDVVTKEPVSGPAVFPSGFAAEGLLGFETTAASRGAVDPVLGILRRDTGSGGIPVVEIFSRNPAPDYGPMNTIQAWEAHPEHENLISGFPAGADNAGWFLSYGRGSSVLGLFPSASGASELLDLGAPVAKVQFLPEVDDEVLVIFQHGEMAIYDFTPGSGFALQQQFVPPVGMKFVGASGGGGTLVALIANGFGQLVQFQFFEKGDDDYELINQGGWPVLPMTDGGVTVVLYTGDPFSSPAPFPFETFLAGDWASDAVYDSGLISTFVETFGGTTQGLGNPAPQVFAPAADPGTGAVAVGNQWEPSSSVFYMASAPIGDGAAAVAINPPPGSYPVTVGVTFQAGENVTVYYRVNQNQWQSGLGPVWLTQNATVDYYGEHGGGALGSIQSAFYQINQSLMADSDGDGVPDVIEEMAGTNPFDPDTDGNGVGDFNTILYGNDPIDPDSLPFDQVKVEVFWDDSDSVAMPAAGKKLFVGNLSNHLLQTAEAAPMAPRKYGDITLKRGVTDDEVGKFWFPVTHPTEETGVPAMTAFGGIPSAPLPVIPVNLDAPDPLEAWRQAARAAVEEHSAKVFEFTIGPSSTTAALIFEYWYGARLVELGRLASIADRPRLADSPMSVRAGVATHSDLEAIRTPQGAGLISHELAHVVQQINTEVLTGEASQPLRETAEAFYSQAIDAAQSGNPLDPPIDALRLALTGEGPVGYILPYSPAELNALRELIIEAVTPRGRIVLTGTLMTSGDHLLLLANSNIYSLLDRSGRPYRLTGAGLIVDGSTAFVTGFLIQSNGGSGDWLGLEVSTIELETVPAAPDTDIKGNGLPDSWAWAFLGHLDYGFWDDINGDGFVLGEEYLAGTDPTDPLSLPPGAPAIPRDLAVTFDALGNPVVEWSGSFAADYALLRSFNLMHWDPHPGNIQKEGDRRHSVNIDTDEPREFFRLEIRFDLP